MKLLLVPILCLCSFSVAFAGEAKVERQLSTFQSRGKSIRIEWFRGNPKGDTVIFLYGSGGIEKKDGYFRYFADTLAKRGYNCAILHYFDRDGIAWASSAQMGQHFSDWLLTIKDAIAYAEKQTGNKKVALVGHSLGAQLALVEASRDKQVSAIVDMSGSLVFPLKAKAKLPPVLIIHGDKDSVVPLKKEKHLETVLKGMGTHFEKKIFPGQGHSFDLKPALEVIDLADDFLQRMI